MNGKKIKKATGFSLVELLMVILLLGIGLVGVSGMFTAGVISNRKAAHFTIAANCAEKEVERIRDGGYGNANMSATLFPYPDYSIVSSTQASFVIPELPDGRGNVYIDLDPEAQVVDATTGLQISNLKRLRVTISWGGAKSANGTYSLTTLLANRP